MATSAIESLARFAAELRPSDIPVATRELARAQLASIVAAYATGFASPAVRRIARGLGVPVEEPFPLPLQHPDRAALLGALCAASMAHDYDDYLFMGHTGHSAVGTALVLASGGGPLDSARGRQAPAPEDGDELLARIVIGNEIGGRLGASCFFGPHNGQLWSTIHLLIAAALHARSLGLPAEGIAHAIAIAFSQPTYALPAAFMGTETKLLTAAIPAMQGFRAAELAAAGVRGNVGLFEAPRGFWESFTFVPLPSMITGLGRTWLTDTLCFKRYPGCAYLGPVLEALGEIREQGPIDPASIESIDIEASFLTVEMDELARPHRESRPDLDPVLVNFSVADTVALGLLTGGMRCGDLEPESLSERKDAIRALASRVRLHHAWDLSLELLRATNRTLPLSTLFGDLSFEKLREVRRQARRHHGRTLDLGLSAVRKVGRELSAREAAALARFLSGKAFARGGRAPRFDLGHASLVAFELPVGARVALTVSGKRRTASVRRPTGSPQTPRVEVVREKFLRDVGAALGERDAAAAWKDLMALPASWLHALEGPLFGAARAPQGAAGRLTRTP